MAGPSSELPALPDDVLARMNMTPARWERVRAALREREAFAPAVGEPAPGFELPVLGDAAQTVRLSAFRGERAVALIFGSYT